MKVLHMVSGIDPRSGGPTRSITGLCRALANLDIDTTLFVHSPEHPFLNSEAVRFRKGGGCDLRTLRKDAKAVIGDIRPDVIHFHGLWMLANHIDACAARRMNIPYVLAPRGMLEPWSLQAKKWKKLLALWLYQRRDLDQAAALHATAESEAKQFRKLGFRQPIIISPNGVDIPSEMPPRAHRADGTKTILFLSRIHPKKGLLELVEAWAKCKRACENASPGSTRPSWHIEYAGPDYQGYLALVKRRMSELGLGEDFTYLGDLSDQDKWVAYCRADLFVLPTYSENFGIVVAEALAAGVPVITTKGAPWAELLGSIGSSKVLKFGSAKVKEDALAETVASGNQSCESCNVVKTPPRTSRCGWWIDIGVEPLTDALREAMGLTGEERRTMGENGRKLVEAKYTWSAIAEQMQAAYEWLLNGGVKPPCVIYE